MWFFNLLTEGGGIAHTVILFALVISAGVFLGHKVKIAGISLGVTWILFVGILVGHILNQIGCQVDGEWVTTYSQENWAVITFVQELGLILFVFSIGLQVGPSFFTSLKQGGMKANAIAAGIVTLNITVMLTLYYSCRNFIEAADNLPMMVGTLCGAVTNTPGLGAANAALQSVNDATHIYGDSIPAIANGYACAYPLGVVGIILSIILVKVFCKVNFKEELDHFNKKNNAAAVKPYLMTLKVDNNSVAGKNILQVRQFIGRDFVCSRILHDDHVEVPNKETSLEVGDCLYIVSAKDDAEAISAFIGPEIEMDWEIQDVTMETRKITVTNSAVNGKTLGSFHPSSFYGINVTRMYRSGVDIFASPSVILQVGDIITAVGPGDALDRFATKLGDSKQALDKPNLLTLFFGILIGIIFGMIPIAIPGMSMPVKLGLAGGPLVIAIILGRFGYKVRLVSYTTNSASLMIRDIGLVLFLAGVGIKAGGHFIETVVGGGYHYVWMGFLITVVPLLVMGLFARLRWHMNYFLLMGIMSGATTDPPALAFSSAQADNGIPSVGYSTVYPLSMFLRIITAQVLILLLCC